MFSLNANTRFYLYPYPTDMRKSFYTLSGIVTDQMGLNVQNGDAFVFVNRQLTNLKILHAEYGGLVIYNLKLEVGSLVLPNISEPEIEAFRRKIDWTEILTMVRIDTETKSDKQSLWAPKKGQK